MDFLWLLVLTTLLLSGLIAAALYWPAHGIWERVDVWYYSLALVGVLLFFLTESDERSLAQALDAKTTHAARLKQLKRFQPAFAPPYPGDPGIAEGAYDLVDIRSFASTCRTDGPEREQCVAARQFASHIDAAFGDLMEPPISPTVDQAEAYAEQFCNGVERLGGRATEVIDPSLQPPLRAGLASLADGAPRDPHTLTQMRMAILKGKGQRTPQVDFAITVLNAASACPAHLATAGQFRQQADDWSRKVQRHERLLRAAERKLRQVRSRGSDELHSGDITLLTFAKGLWPFFVSAALCLKLARATRDLRARRTRMDGTAMR